MEGSVDGLLAVLKEGEDWEGVVFEGACAAGREVARELLERLDEALAAGRTEKLRIEGFRTRTVLTRMGPVRVRRRLYREGKRGRFLLDESLGWSRHRAVSPTLSAIAAELASRMPYRMAAEALGKMISQSIGATTLHRLVQTLGAAVSQAEERSRRSVYEQGKTERVGTEVADPLFVEADGVSIPLQRESQRRGELKVAVSYHGVATVSRNPKGRPRRKLLGKVTYAGMEDRGQFWEGAWIRIGERYDLDPTKRVVLGGDGAGWIRGGLEGVGEGLFQLDRFHLAREFMRVLCGAGMTAFQAAISGDDQTVREMLIDAWRKAGDDPKRGEELLALEGYLSNNRDGIVDWRRRANVVSDVRLGAMESNIDKPFATRFKKRGMSWTRRGAHNMAKVLELRANGELASACAGLRTTVSANTPRLRPATAASTAPQTRRESPPPFQATFAPRWGPHASRTWVQALCRLIDGPTMRN